jgi:hypothetical protein
MIGTVGCIYSALTYTKKVYDYVRSQEFQKDTEKASELAGKPLAQFLPEFRRVYQQHLTTKLFQPLLENRQQFLESQ